MYYLVDAKKMRGGDARPCGADVESLSELNEFRPRSVRAPQEHGYLQSDPGRPTALYLIQLLAFSEGLAIHSTAPLVLTS